MLTNGYKDNGFLKYICALTLFIKMPFVRELLLFF